MPSPAVQLVEQLTGLEKAQLVRPANEPELAYLFKHALTQEAVYQSLLKTTRADLHRRVAAVIEELAPEQREQNAPILFLHYEQAGLNDKAFQYAVLAGQRAARAFAHVEALTFFDRALQLASLLATQDSERALTMDIRLVYVQKGRVFEVMGNHAAAVEIYLAMVEFAQKVGDAAMEADGLNHLVTARVVLAGPGHATAEQLERALALAHGVGNSELMARTLWNRGLALRFQEPQRAVDSFAQALDLAEAANLQELAAYIRLDSQVALALLGHAQQARALAQQALDNFRALDLKPMIADALETVAYYAYTRGDPTAARAFAEEGLNISRTIGNPWGILNNDIELLVLDLAGGNLARVLADSEATIPHVRELGNPPFVLACYSLLTQACLHLNDLRGARGWMDQAIREFAGDENPFFSLWAGWLESLVLIKGGELARANALLKPLMSQRQFPLAPFDRYSWVCQTMAELAFLENRLGEGLDLCDALLAEFEREEQAGHAAGILYWRAMLRRARGDIVHAGQDALRASELAADAENRILAWRADALAADIYRAGGNETSAQEHRERARATIHYIAEHAPPELRASFLDSADVRQAMQG